MAGHVVLTRGSGRRWPRVSFSSNHGRLRLDHVALLLVSYGKPALRRLFTAIPALERFQVINMWYLTIFHNCLPSTLLAGMARTVGCVQQALY